MNLGSFSRRFTTQEKSLARRVLPCVPSQVQAHSQLIGYSWWSAAMMWLALLIPISLPSTFILFLLRVSQQSAKQVLCSFIWNVLRRCEFGCEVTPLFRIAQLTARLPDSSVETWVSIDLRLLTVHKIRWVTLASAFFYFTLLLTRAWNWVKFCIRNWTLANYFI